MSKQVYLHPFLFLIGAAFLTVALWQLPYGSYIIYPFTALSTWFHEMGHGLCVLILGGTFERLVIYSDASGIAYHSGPLLFGKIGEALCAAAGPVGPALAGACFIIFSRTPRSAATILFLLGTLLLLSVFIWVRSIFGILSMTGIGIVIIFVVFLGSSIVKQFSLQLLGVQACISTWQQIDYLFMKKVTIDGEYMLSDTGQIAESLLLPYWFWGALIALTSLWLLYTSLRRIFAH